LVFDSGHEIAFAHTSFKWANLASHNAGVTVVIIGISSHAGKVRRLFSVSDTGEVVLKKADNINAYLVAGSNIIVNKIAKPIGDKYEMDFGSKPVDGGNLFLDRRQYLHLLKEYQSARDLIRFYSNSDEFINGKSRYCLWIDKESLGKALAIPPVEERLKAVAKMRLNSTKKQTKKLANFPYLFAEIRHQQSSSTIVVPRVSSENRDFLPVGLVKGSTIIGDRNFALYDAPLWNMALIASRLHWVWIGTVCVRMRTDFFYSNTLGWNTFPVPKLTEKNKADLTKCAEAILLAREAHFPATIADLYKPDTMPENLRQAHARNDEILERIYIGRRFKNDTERLEKLFDLYTKMTAKAS